MARPSREAIDTFMSITGAPEAVAVRKLEEHNSDLNEAVNAHFNEGDGDHVSRPRVNETPVAAPDDDMMDVDDPIQDVSRRSPLSLLSESGNVNPFSLDSHLNRGLFDAGLNFTRQEPFVTHPREVRQIPIEVKDGSETSAHSTHAPIIEDVTGTTNAHGPDTHGPVIIDDDDEEDIAAAAAHPTRPSAPVYDNVPDYGNDIEEEMVRAAIEASKKDAELGQSEQNNLGSSEHLGKQPHMEDAELAHAVSLSMKSAEQEKAICDHGEKVGASNDRFDVGSSSNQDDAGDAEHQPLTRNRPKRSLSPSREAAAEASPATSPRQDDLGNPTQHNRDAFVSDEWGGISSLEHDEAVMLEAAMFGGIPEGPGFDFPRQFLQSGRAYAQRTPRPPSPSLEAQRILREQQDDEYLASLQADQEKELRAKAEAEARRLQEEAAKEAALKEERQREEENRRKLQEEQELEKLLATKEASLPEEPSADDENAITLLVRMPDGSRRGRRFLKSDKLQLLFDFIDIGRAVKPGTYRVVRPYPRRAFSDGESSLTLNELGLTSKQEALFLELI